MFDLTDKIFSDKEAARKHLEGIRWADGRFCPHCGECERTSPVKSQKSRPGLYYCNSCKKQFTVTVGTLFERSKVPLNKWIAAFHLMTSSKKGISAHQIHRMLGVTYKTAWFMCHRIREAMRPGADFGPLGGEGKTVEADETFIGGKVKNMHRSKRPTKKLGGSWGKETVFSLVERGGRVKSVHTPSVSAATLRPILFAQVDRKSFLMTDDAGQYRHMNRDFKHTAVNHSAGEYVRGEAHTNTVEGYFSILKRGVTGTYHHVSQKHLKRYLAEFDFRYNERSALGVTDTQRANKALAGIEGKRMTYQQPDGR
tara:strand:- start:782 stop:1717 length:936 start_codon:yes stop_codon:yes gene_type:complete